MPQIDPKQLLKTLGILLSPSGGIKSSEEVERLVKLMSKFSRKLVSKCIYVQILTATSSDLLTKWLHEGGWSLLNTWFEDAIKTQNWPMVKEMLILFEKCPVTADLLKEQTNEHHAPKLINQLRQEPSVQTEIRSLASEIYKSWVAVVSARKSPEPLNDSENGEDSVSLLQSLADEVADSLKKPEIDEPLDDDFPKIRKVPTVQKPKSTIIDGSIKINKKNLPSSHPLKDTANKKESKDKESSSKRRSSDKDKEKSSKRFRPDHLHRDEVNPEEKQRIKDMARKMKEEAQAKKEKEKTTTSSLGKIPKIPKKPVTDDAKKGPKSFEEMLGGLDSKPKTVKTTSIVKNKTAALLEGMKSNSSKSSSSSSSSSSKSSSSSSSSSRRDRDHHHHSSSSHHKRDHHHSSSSHHSSRSKDKNDKKLSLTMPTTPESNSSKKNKSETESPKSASSKSPQVYSESSSFMDALFSSMGVPTARKKKRRLSESKDEKSPPAKAVKKDVKEEAKEEQQPIPENNTENNPPMAFSFYQDTLETKEVTEDEVVNENGNDDEEVKEESKEENGSTEMNESSNNGKEEPEEKLPFEEPDAMPREVKGILVYHRGRDKRDKKITWRPETELVAVQYFEVDENERVNVNKLKFENMREFESKMEKAAMKSKGAMSDEDMSTIPWYNPVPIKVTNREPFEPGQNSKEKEIQNDREKGVLQEIYFTREMTPDTPKEADPETNSMKSGQPIMIPTEDAEADVNGVMHYAHKPWPEAKENQVSKQAQMESQFSLPPALSSLLSSINKTGIEGIIPPNLNAMSKEEQDTLMAQTEAMKKLGMLPPVNNPQPAMNEPPPSIPPSDFRVPPPGNNQPFNGPPPFGGPPPSQNGFYQQPPPFANQRGDYHSNGRGGNNGYRGYRSNGPPQRGGFRDYNDRGGYQDDR